MNSNNPEILAPGGDFNSSIHALKSGADAVYIGLKSFSARKKATNFDLEELRTLKEFCINNRKKIYVAINTILEDFELKELYSTLFKLEKIKVDGVIVQDIGLASIIKDRTNLTLHASTQIAAHNIHGIKALNKAGFDRVVLSRELSLKEIKTIKEAFPKMELEVFIHGAMCYGFSGLCMASANLLNRSANKGECGQICRTWFNNNGKKEYCFSMNDLALKDKILKLKEIGVESLKIEGRLKGPNYATSASKLYFNILNGQNYSKEEDLALTEFNRDGGDRYLLNKKGSPNINFEYPSHTGIYLGKITNKGSNTFTVKTNSTIENRDGIFIPGENFSKKPLKFAANIIKKDKNTITFKGDIPNGYKDEIYKISNHDKHLKEEKVTSYKKFKTPIVLNIYIEWEQIRIVTPQKEFSYPIKIEPGKNQVNIEQLFNKIFKAGGDTNYSFPCNIVKSVPNPFIPNSVLKDIRNKFQTEFILLEDKSEVLLENNNKIEFRSYQQNSDTLPFIVDFTKVDQSKLLMTNNKYLLPLAPVIFDSEKYLKELKEFLNTNKNKFIIGLNNIGHLAFIEELPEEQEYYGDYGLYTANSFAINFIENFTKNILWTTKWIERDQLKFYPPLFISRTCFMAQKNGGCPKGCPKDYEFNISQQKNYKVIVKDCITYTFTISPSGE